MVFLIISGLWAHLSRGCRVRQAIEHQEFGRFSDIARHGGKAVKAGELDDMIAGVTKFGRAMKK